LWVRGNDAHVRQLDSGAGDEEVADRKHELAGDAQRRLVDEEIERGAHRALDRILDREHRLIGQTGLDRGDEGRKRGEGDEVFRRRAQQRRFLAERAPWSEDRRGHLRPFVASRES
jgi:hypothetical protein